MMTQPEDVATPSEADLKTILSKLNPTEIEVDSLGRIVVRSPEVREALRNVAARIRDETTADAAPTNGSQCACHNLSGCHGGHIE